MATRTVQKGLNSGCLSTILDKESRQRYVNKLKLVNGSDPCENEWEDRNHLRSLLHVPYPQSKPIHKGRHAQLSQL